MAYFHTITAAEAGQRLMQFCKTRITLPYAGLQKALRTKAIRINGQKDDGQHILQSGDIIKSLFPFETPLEYIPTPHLYTVLYEDEHLLVIEKPIGIPVHGGSKHDTSLLTHIHGSYPPSDFAPQPLHRLDKDTSGVLLLGKTNAMLRHGTQAFREGTVEKCYHGIVHGTPPAQGSITAPLLTSEHGPTKTIIHPEGQPAHTDYTLLHAGTLLSHVALYPRTGRTHQLRVHLQSLHHPLLGDPRYGDAVLDRTVYQHLHLRQRLYLHCHQLTLPMLDGSTRTFTSPLPTEFSQAASA